MRHWLLASGGSGGHLAPAIAIAQEWHRLKGSSVVFTTEKAVDRHMRELYPDIQFIGLRGCAPEGGFRVLLRSCAALLMGIGEVAHSIVRTKPQGILVTGGFGCAPVVLAGSLCGLAVCAHESNAVPGKVVRYFEPIFRKVFTTALYKDGQCKIGRTWTTGFPLRKDQSHPKRESALKALGLDHRKQLVTFLGGSQGARALTKTAEAWAPALLEKGMQVLCVTGPANYIPEQFADEGVRFLPFVKDMGVLYAASSLVVARSGAGTLAELAEHGCPSILVPLPTAADNHQYLNAKVFVEAGCAVLLEEGQLSSSFSSVLTMLHDLEVLERMKNALDKWKQQQEISNLLHLMLSEERSIAV